MKTTRHSTYRMSTAKSWTRIDMLLALYDGALFAIQQAIEAIRHGQQKKLIDHRHRTQRLITELMAGVDTEQGELANNVHRLLMFCLMQTTGNTSEEWESVVVSARIGTYQSPLSTSRPAPHSSCSAACRSGLLTICPSSRAFSRRR